MQNKDDYFNSCTACIIMNYSYNTHIVYITKQINSTTANALPIASNPGIYTNNSSL